MADRNPRHREFRIYAVREGHAELLASSGSAPFGPTAEMSRPMQARVEQALHECTAADRTCVTPLYNESGGRRVTALSPIATDDGRLVGVLAADWEAVDYNRAVDAAVRQMIYYVAVALAASALMGALASVRITRPLRRLYEGAIAAREGRFEPVPTQGSDEIATLTRSFNETNVSLKEKIDRACGPDARPRGARGGAHRGAGRELRRGPQAPGHHRARDEYRPSRAGDDHPAEPPPRAHHHRRGLHTHHGHRRRPGRGARALEHPLRVRRRRRDGPRHRRRARRQPRPHAALDLLLGQRASRLGIPPPRLPPLARDSRPRDVPDALFVPRQPRDDDARLRRRRPLRRPPLPLVRRGHQPLESRCGIIGAGELFCDREPVGKVGLAAGDFVVLYTDGLIEAINSDGEAFGIDRLISTVSAAARDGSDGGKSSPASYPPQKTSPAGTSRTMYW